LAVEVPAGPFSAFDAAKKSCSQNQQFLRRSFPDRGERNAGIESNEPSFMLNRESKQIYVGQLPRSMNSGRIHESNRLTASGQNSWIS
jgi:hypothetical protein